MVLIACSYYTILRSVTHTPTTSLGTQHQRTAQTPLQMGKFRFPQYDLSLHQLSRASGIPFPSWILKTLNWRYARALILGPFAGKTLDCPHPSYDSLEDDTSVKPDTMAIKLAPGTSHRSWDITSLCGIMVDSSLAKKWQIGHVFNWQDPIRRRLLQCIGKM